MFCCKLPYVQSGFEFILIGKRDLVACLGLSSWCLVVVVWLFLAVSWICLLFVIVIYFNKLNNTVARILESYIIWH